MLSKAEKLKSAGKRAKELIAKLNLKNPKQWDYKLIESDIKQTYKALKQAWLNGENLDSIKDYLSEQGYNLLLSDSRLGKT